MLKINLKPIPTKPNYKLMLRALKIGITIELILGVITGLIVGILIIIFS